MTSNSYELEMDRLLSKANPEYYSALKDVLSDFEKRLIANNIIPDNSFQSYVSLLNVIAKEKELKTDLNYDFNGSLEKTGDGLKTVMLSVEGAMIANKYLNAENSKSYNFHQKFSELIGNNQIVNRSRMANLFLEVYDAIDFELPLVKSNIFKFLDPNSDIFYTYVGKPNRS